MQKSLLPFLAVICIASSQLTFNNPIVDRNSADPAALRLGDSYYLTLSENGERDLTIYKSPILTSFRDAESKIAFSTPQGFENAWASEMHLIDGELYIYFCMNEVGTDHRMYVIKADDPNNPMGNWSSHTRLMGDWDYAAIDGSPMLHANGRKYFLFASTGFGPLSIFIAPMINATTIGFPKIELKKPVEDWECQGGCTNEGPYFLYRNNVSFCIYSVSSTWDPNYALAMMSIEGEQDPMNPENWKFPDGPVFSRNDEEDVYTTGHAAFTVSPDGTETWMVYHGTVNTTHINGFRIARIEKIDWSDEGVPVFPRPHGFNSPQQVPSGQTTV